MPHHLRPALFPGLYIYANGRDELFPLAEAEHVEPEALRQWGMVGYTHRLDDAAIVARVGERPLRIMAYGAFGRHATDIVLRQRDAEQILATEHNRGLLAQGRVVVILSASELGDSLQP